MAYIQHAFVVDVHCSSDIGDTVLIIEIDSGIVDQYVDAAVLLDFISEVSDAASVGDV